jgi:hypothetical protein
LISTSVLTPFATSRAIRNPKDSGVDDFAGQHDAAVDRRSLESRAREAPAQFVGQPGNVIRHFHVENADQLLPLGIDGHARRADFFAEDRERVIGERIDIGNFRIADNDKAAVGPHIF